MDYENTESNQPLFETPDSQPPHTCHWWPPDFLEATPEEVSPCEGEEDLNARLSQSFHVIDRQHDHIRELSDRISTLEQEVSDSRSHTQRIHQRYRILGKTAILLPCICTAVVFHREVSQVGWNLFRETCSIFNVSPQTEMGLLTAVAVSFLFWKVAAATLHAALEEFFPQQEDLP